MNPLILVHGAMSDAGIWRTLIHRLPLDWPVHAVDLAGHGTRRDAAGPFTAARFADDVSDFARSMLGPARPIAVGWSLGASVVLRVAAMEDKVLAGAILVGATPQLEADDLFPDGQPAAVAAAREQGLATAFGATARHFARQIAGGDQMAEAIIAQGAEAADPQVAIAIFRDAPHASLVPLLPAIRTPLRLIHGTRDAIVSPKAAAWIAHHAPDAAPPALIEQAGHAPFLTHPEAFDAALVSAVSAIRDRSFGQVPAGNGEMQS
jgi:pimeloyl-[acyl-carrier protein] methyl ester esterase